MIERLRRLPLPGPVGWTASIAGFSAIYMAFVMPLGRGTDEAEHAFRAFQIATGGLFPEIVRCMAHTHFLPCKIHYPGHHLPGRRTGGRVSVALYHFYTLLESLVQKPGEGTHFDPSIYSASLGSTLGGPATIFAHFENTALYSPANYLPQTLIMWIGHVASASVVGALFAARVLTGIVWAAAVTAAVAIAPRWKWLVSLVVLVPTALTSGAMLSTDSSALALSALTIAYALRIGDRGAPPSRVQLALLALLCLLLGLLKVPSPVLLLAVLAIVWRSLGSAWARVARAAAVVLPGLAAAAWWTAASNAYFVPYRNTIFPANEQANIIQAAQEHYLLSHLYDVPALLWNTATSGMLLHFGGIVGTIGEDGGAGPLPEWFAAIWLGLLVVLAIGTHEGPNPRRGLRASLAGTGLLYGLVAAFGIYITWVSVGAARINGIHGRYYTPALILAVPMLAGLGPIRWRIPQRPLAAAVMLVTTACVVTVVVRMSTYYYSQAPWTVVGRVFSAVF